MQEISSHIFIETSYPGVTLGAISWSHGLALIDSPFRPDDIRSWRATLLNLGGGVDRMLINMDAHLDRTLGARGMDCTVVGHELMAQVFRNRPVTFKAQSSETGAEWELYDNLGSIRWAPPELTFSQELSIYWDECPLILEHHPGPATGAIWAILPEQGILFLGDAVALDQPPFLAAADLPAWIEELKKLTAPTFRNYLLVSSRGGLVANDQLHRQIEFLETVNQQIESLPEGHNSPEDSEKLAEGLLKKLTYPREREAQYLRRLRWGLHQYTLRHYRTANTEPIEE